LTHKSDTKASTPVLLVSPSATAGGAERAFAGLARTLPAMGFHPIAALLQRGPLEDWLREADCETHMLPSHRTRNVARTLRTVGGLRRLARSTGARVVVSNMSKGHFFGGLAARAAHIPAVFWQHQIPGPSLIERVAGAVPARAIACCSHAAASAQRALTPGRQICKIHPGIRSPDVRSVHGSGASIKRSLGWENNPTVGVVGRLQPWKGQEIFLRAAAKIAEHREETRFIVVGGAILGWEGSYPDDLRRLAAELGIYDRVHFAGHQCQIDRWYDALDVVVHASFDEPFGLVLVEAMALGKPLVATGVGGPLEIVEDGTSGLLVPPGDPGVLAGAVGRILADPGLASTLSRGAAKRSTAFTEERTAEEFANLLATVMAEGPRHRTSQLTDRDGPRAQSSTEP
jgi:glycosyltransferase involved in cell wall biosynthesis